MSVTFCNWCPDPKNPSPIHHPNGQTRHEVAPGGRMKIVVALSGGLDSAVMLADVMDQFPEAQILAVGFQYGQSHGEHEGRAKNGLINHFNTIRKEKKLPPVVGKTIDIAVPMYGINSALLTGDIPEGHYNEETMRQTVVPNRNMIFLSFLTAYAISIEAERVYIGVHAGDHFIYPDCRPGFIGAMRAAVFDASDAKVSLWAPFLYRDKRAIVSDGLIRKVPFQLTRTCYKNQAVACGKCGSCQERLEAFKLNSIEDPLPYESRDLIPKQTPVA